MCNPWLFKTIRYIWLHYWWPEYFPITESVFHQTPVFAPYVRVNHVHVYHYNLTLLIFILGVFFSGRECCCSCQTATSFWTSSSRTLTQHRLVITPCKALSTPYTVHHPSYCIYPLSLCSSPFSVQVFKPDIHGHTPLTYLWIGNVFVCQDFSFIYEWEWGGLLDDDFHITKYIFKSHRVRNSPKSTDS